MSVIGCRPFGVTPEGEPVTSYTLRSASGMTAEILTYGAILRVLSVPGKEGPDDVVLGYDTLADYLADSKFLGAVVGRCANRIRDARFVLGGKPYQLEANNGAQSLHGGLHGFHTKVWTASIVRDALMLRYVSPGGEGGYPGRLDVRVTYALEDNRLILDYCAESDADTVVSLSNHSYFNLNGHGAGTVLDHLLKVYASFFLPIDGEAVPTGEVRPVDQTPFDFRTPVRIGDPIGRPDPQLSLGGGFDHNFVIKPAMSPALMPVATLLSEESGRRMDCWSSQPGVQVYSGNHLDGMTPGKGGAMYTMCTGLCLETQNWPNAVNQANFPSPVLRAGDTYHQRTVYEFRDTDRV